jgi:ubiquinone/menaquinone biosynthesis C-methylase UbiE
MDFDQKAKEWDKDPKKVERAKAFAKEIVDFIGNRNLKHAIEFGSGTGLVSFQLKDRFQAITLADNSSGMMEVLEEKIRNEFITNMKPFLIDDLNDLTKLSGFDIIYTLLALHHVKNTDALLSYFSSILKTGGFICLGDLMTEDGSFHHKDPEFDGHKGFDTEKLKDRLTSVGFKIELDKIFHVIEKEHNAVMKKYPLFMIIGKKL